MQPITCNVDNILIVNKFPPCHEFLQLWIQTEDTGNQVWRIRWVMEQFETDISDGITRCLWWVRCEQVQQHTATQLSSSLLFQCSSIFSSQIWSTYSTDPSESQNTVAITLWADITRRNFLGGREVTCFTSHTLCFTFWIYRVGQIKWHHFTFLLVTN